MSPSLTRDVRRLLGPADPADGRPLTAAPGRRADLDRILATPQLRQARPAGRRLVAVAAALVLLVIAGLQFAPQPRPAFAATPPPLQYTAAAGSAREVLTGIADRAATASDPARSGDYEHLVIRSWSLWTYVDDERVTSAIIPSRTESWRGSDNSGRRSTSYEKAQFTSLGREVLWRAQNLFDDGLDPWSQEYAAGQFGAMWADQPPIGDLDRWLHIGHPRENGPFETLVAVTDLARERLLTPATRSGLLRIVAQLPGLTYDGTVTDRAGRAGAAFSITSDRTGLPTRHTLIVDPATGALLGYEQMLPTDTGKLDVRAPAVIGYETYLTADYTTLPK
ncbi:CU044_5270 family protein [Actinoplanes sp. NPDC026670]|uniref:CU044_5270 family protein n=1 Tax=Actinoplanes sp. NPDC026670 TaxID=3154700 RepID=UPI0033CFFB62